MALARNALLDARPMSAGEAEVVIGFDPEFAGHREKVDTPRVRTALGKKLSQLLGRDVGVRFGVLEEESETAPLPADHGPEPTQPPGGKGGGVASRADWHNDPAVQKTLEMFHGDIVDIRD